MITWSPSSWTLWKECPHKYYLRKIDRKEQRFAERDPALAKLAVPGLFVDRMLQLWLYRNSLHDKDWLQDNMRMVWSMVCNEMNPKWASTEEEAETRDEATQGLQTAVEMLSELRPDRYDLLIQPSFLEQISRNLGITGAADLLLVERDRQAGLLIDFKNAHRRERMTRDQLIIYQIGLTRKLSVKVERAGYLLYNPRLQQWKWFKISTAQEEKLLVKLEEATEDVEAARFEPRWNHFTCIK